MDRIAVKLWDLQKGVELATLYFSDQEDWAVISPGGLFDASPGMMQQMYYVYDYAVIELEQLKKRYWEPGLLTQLLQNKPLRDVSAFGALPLYPRIEADITDNQLKVNLTQRSGGIGKLSLFVNGKELKENINPAKQTALTIDLAQFNASFLDTNTLALRAFIADGWLKSQDYELKYHRSSRSSPYLSKAHSWTLKKMRMCWNWARQWPIISMP